MLFRSRSTDAVARLGGDEFALLLPETGAESAMVLVRRVRKVFLESMRQKEWPVTLSIGMMTFIKSPASVDDIMHRTDVLMYFVKAEGKDGIRHEVVKESITAGRG